MPEPHLRAADADREAVATRLGEHMAAGRLTVAEYDERLARVYAAKTYGDLDALTADLPAAPTPTTAPGTTGAPAPTPAPRDDVSSTPGRAPAPGWGGGWGGGWDDGHGWRAWAGTSVIVVTIWLITGIAGGFGYFWPIWVIGPWGAVLLAQAITGRGDGGDGRRRLDR
jgi:Domain of unknown function (DUF1707)